MLSLYVSVLNASISIGGAGGEATIGRIAKDVGLTYHRTKTIVNDLVEFGMLYRHVKHHRPNVMKSYFDATIVGSSWVHLMNLNRMKGF